MNLLTAVLMGLSCLQCVLGYGSGEVTTQAFPPVGGVTK